MTTRLTRWLTTLDNFEAKMAQLPAVRRYGRLTRATGLVYMPKTFRQKGCKAASSCRSVRRY